MKKLIIALLLCSGAAVSATSVYITNNTPRPVTLRANGTTASCDAIAAAVFTFGVGAVAGAAAESDIDSGKIGPSWDQRSVTIQPGYKVGICRVESSKSLRVWFADPALGYRFAGKHGDFYNSLDIAPGKVWEVFIV